MIILEKFSANLLFFLITFNYFTASAAATPSVASKTPKSTEKHDARKKKKSFYAQLKKTDESSNILSQLNEKYRDRAKERREGGVNTDPNFDMRNSSGYRAVAPDMNVDANERRRKIIQESKFLGGDLLHTHLVKGLDYALLNKVRLEITHQEKIQEAEMEKIVEEQNLEIEKQAENEKESDEMQIKTIMGKNIQRLITVQKSKTIERNEMFIPGRMAYLIDLEEENQESDIPTTIIRSKSEYTAATEMNVANPTHDIVVNKLVEIFSYLRQGNKKKNKKRDKEIFKLPDEEPQPTTSKAPPPSSSKSKRIEKEEDTIYGNIGDYKAPSHKERRRYDEKEDYYKSSSSSSKNKSKRSYFDKPNEEEPTIQAPAPPKLPAQFLSKLNAPEIDGYAECYPGLEEMDDAVIDSDDEVDFTKMDKGNKKGPIGRWDFETQEEYSEYMSSKEALPKAAFQYGLKMSEGRKTRKNKNENQKLDQEWQKIQKIITKRKGEADSGEIDFKKSKH